MFSQKQIEKAMKKMGMKTEELDVDRVVFESKKKNLVINNPLVSKIEMSGNTTFQVVGEAEEQTKEKFTKDDIEMVKEQTGCSEEDVKKALEETGDIAEAILKLKE